MSVDYDAWLDRKLYEYDREREQNDYQQQLEQRNLNLTKYKITRSDWALCALLGICYGTLLFLFIK